MNQDNQDACNTSNIFRIRVRIRKIPLPLRVIKLNMSREFQLLLI